MARLVRDLTVPKIRGLERALARGLSAGGKPLADAAILWLCDRPSRFHLGDGRNELYNAPATTLIRSLAPVCSQSVFERLQSTILSYHDDWERISFHVQFEYAQKGNYSVGNSWGEAQNHLLHALPVDRMSLHAIHRASIWRAKCGDPSEKRPLSEYSSGGWVTSSIPPSRRQLVSDREWRRIIAREWPKHDGRPWKQHDPDTVGEASLKHFAEAFGNAAQQAPKRFAKLALKIPPTADPAYFAALVGALAKCPASEDEPNNVTVRELEAIVDHIGNCRNAAYVHSLCRLIESHSEVVWSDAVLHRIVSYVDHPEPRAGEFTMHASRSSDGQMEPDIETSAINCVRGCVAGAINHLLWICPDAYEGLSSAAERLLADENPAVRLEAIGACLPIWNRDKDRAIRLVLSACDHPDDRVLQGRWLSRLIRYARGTHLDDLAPLIDRMAKSSMEKVARRGSAWATACWLDDGHLPELFTLCRSGSKAQRLGVATAAVEYATSGDSCESGHPLIIELFDDEDSDVRSEAAQVFRIEGVFDRPGGTDLTSAYVRSRAFLDDPHSLFYPLSDYRGALASLAVPILEAVDVMCNQLAEPSRDISRGVGLIGNEASTLLLRLYELAYGNNDEQLQSMCLDRWDAMLRNRVGMTETHLKQLDD